MESDTDQEEQDEGFVGGGKGVQQGIVSAKDFYREHQCQDKGVQNNGTSTFGTGQPGICCEQNSSVLYSTLKKPKKGYGTSLLYPCQGED